MFFLKTNPDCNSNNPHLKEDKTVMEKLLSDLTKATQPAFYPQNLNFLASNIVFFLILYITIVFTLYKF